LRPYCLKGFFAAIPSNTFPLALITAKGSLICASSFLARFGTYAQKQSSPGEEVLRGGREKRKKNRKKRFVRMGCIRFGFIRARFRWSGFNLTDFTFDAIFSLQEKMIFIS
jgi:hypothetical protein